MKSFVCIRDNVFFNKKIYNYGDKIYVDDELAKSVNPVRFQELEEFEKGQEIVTKRVSSAEKNNRTIKEIIMENEEEKRKMVKEYESKIKTLEKQVNPKVKNDL